MGEQTSVLDYVQRLLQETVLGVDVQQPREGAEESEIVTAGLGVALFQLQLFQSLVELLVVGDQKEDLSDDVGQVLRSLLVGDGHFLGELPQHHHNVVELVLSQQLP